MTRRRGGGIVTGSAAAVAQYPAGDLVRLFVHEIVTAARQRGIRIRANDVHCSTGSAARIISRPEFRE
jgi:hypothetical protein